MMSRHRGSSILRDYLGDGTATAAGDNPIDNEAGSPTVDLHHRRNRACDRLPPSKGFPVPSPVVSPARDGSSRRRQDSAPPRTGGGTTPDSNEGRRESDGDQLLLLEHERNSFGSTSTNTTATTASATPAARRRKVQLEIDHSVEGMSTVMDEDDDGEGDDNKNDEDVFYDSYYEASEDATTNMAHRGRRQLLPPIRAQTAVPRYRNPPKTNEASAVSQTPPRGELPAATSSTDAATAATTTAPAPRGSRLSAGLQLSPFSPLLNRRRPRIGRDEEGEEEEEEEEAGFESLAQSPPRSTTMDGPKSYALNDLSLSICRKVSVVVTVSESFAVPDIDADANGNRDRPTPRRSNGRGNQICLFPVDDAFSPRKSFHSVSPTAGSPDRERRGSPSSPSHITAAASTAATTDSRRDSLVVVDPAAFGRHIPIAVAMDTARLVAQIAHASSEDWARVYQFHQVLWSRNAGHKTDALRNIGSAIVNDLLAPGSIAHRIVLGTAMGAVSGPQQTLQLFGIVGKESVARVFAQPDARMTTADILERYGLAGLVVHGILERLGSDTVCTLSVLEIADEEMLFDLLASRPYAAASGGEPRVKIHFGEAGASVASLSEAPIDSLKHVGHLLRRAFTAALHANRRSGRGHILVSVHVFAKRDPSKRTSCIFVDLAAVDRDDPAASSARRKNAAVRKAHWALGGVLRAALLKEAGNDTPISYRESLLTKVLQRSMMQTDSRTVVLASVSPDSSQYNETMETLRYVNRLLYRPGQVAPSPFSSLDSNPSELASPTTLTLLHPLEPTSLFSLDQFDGQERGMLQVMLSDPRQRLAKVMKPTRKRSDVAEQCIEHYVPTEYNDPDSGDANRPPKAALRVQGSILSASPRESEGLNEIEGNGSPTDSSAQPTPITCNGRKHGQGESIFSAEPSRMLSEEEEDDSDGDFVPVDRNVSAIDEVMDEDPYLEHPPQVSPLRADAGRVLHSDFSTANSFDADEVNQSHTLDHMAAHVVMNQAARQFTAIDEIVGGNEFEKKVLTAGFQESQTTKERGHEEILPVVFDNCELDLVSVTNGDVEDTKMRKWESFELIDDEFVTDGEFGAATNDPLFVDDDRHITVDDYSADHVRETPATDVEDIDHLQCDDDRCAHESFAVNPDRADGGAARSWDDEISLLSQQSRIYEGIEGIEAKSQVDNPMVLDELELILQESSVGDGEEEECAVPSLNLELDSCGSSLEGLLRAPDLNFEKAFIRGSGESLGRRVEEKTLEQVVLDTERILDAHLATFLVDAQLPTELAEQLPDELSTDLILKGTSNRTQRRNGGVCSRRESNLPPAPTTQRRVNDFRSEQESTRRAHNSKNDGLTDEQREHDDTISQPSDRNGARALIDALYETSENLNRTSRDVFADGEAYILDDRLEPSIGELQLGESLMASAYLFAGPGKVSGARDVDPLTTYDLPPESPSSKPACGDETNASVQSLGGRIIDASDSRDRRRHESVITELAEADPSFQRDISIAPSGQILDDSSRTFAAADIVDDFVVARGDGPAHSCEVPSRPSTTDTTANPADRQDDASAAAFLRLATVQLEKEISDRQAELEKVKQGRSEVVKIAEEAIATQAELEQRVNELEFELSQHAAESVPRDDFEALESAFAAITHELEEATRHVFRCNGELDDRNIFISELQFSLRSLEMEQRHLVESLSRQQDEIEALKETLRNAHSTESDVVASKSEVARLTEELQSNQAEKRHREAELLRELKGMDESVERYKRAAVISSIENSALQEEAQLDANARQKEISQLREEHDILRAEHLLYPTNVNDLEQRLADLQLDNNNLAQELEQTRISLDSRVSDVGELTTNLKSLLFDREKDQSKIFQMERAISSFQDETRSRVERVVRHRNEAASLLEKAVNENKSLVESNQQLQVALENLKRDRDAADVTARMSIADATDRSDTSREQNSALAETNERISIELELENQRRTQGASGENAADWKNRLARGAEGCSSRRNLALDEQGEHSSRPKYKSFRGVTSFDRFDALGIRIHHAAVSDLQRAEEVAAHIAFSAKSKIELNRSETHHLKEKLFALEDAKDDEISALKSRIKAMERRLDGTKIRHGTAW